MIQTLSRSDSRVVCIFQENLERGAARNNGIKHAKGTWIVFLDSDDLFQPNHLENLYKSISKGYPEGILLSRYDFKGAAAGASSAIEGIGSGRVPLSVLLRGNPFACNFCIKNDKFNPLLFRAERALSTMEDWIFLALNYEKIGLRLLETKSVVMREHSGRSMHSHLRLVKSRNAATTLLITQLKLTAADRTILESHSAYFCSLHLSLRGDRISSLVWYFRFVFGPVPVKNKFMQICRIIAGPSLWHSVKRVRRAIDSYREYQ